MPRDAPFAGEPSLHVTLSTAQQNSWADMLELVVPEAVAAAIQTSAAARESLPVDYLEYMGVTHADSEESAEPGGEVSARREEFKAQLRAHLDTVVDQTMDIIDAAADQMGKRYVAVTGAIANPPTHPAP